MKSLALASRTAKEIVRDPLNLVFGLGFPLVVLGLLTAIQANIPVPLFRLESLTPGIAVFGLAFMTLFSATLLARDRETALLQRLCATPVRPWQFLLGYALPMLPIALAQSAVCYGAAILLGLRAGAGALWAMLSLLPSAVLFIATGLLCGCLLNSKQVGGICGALLTNLCAWLSGAWFDLDLVGGVFRDVANALPYAHAVALGRMMLTGASEGALTHLLWVTGYALAISAAVVGVFLGRMKRGI